MLLPVALISTKKILIFYSARRVDWTIRCLVNRIFINAFFLSTALKCIFFILSGIRVLVV